MKKLKLFLCCMMTIVQVLGLLSFSLKDESSGTDLSKPYLWNIENLDRLKSDSNCKKTLKRILKLSNGYSDLPPIVITDKPHSFVDDYHFYCSVAGYWWADSLNTGTYVVKDGGRNPLTKEYDSNRLSELSTRCRYLSVAYYLTGEEKYYNALITQLQAWFVDKDTYMYPNFMYASVIPGKNKISGKSSGMIQAYSFIDVIESILLVNSIHPLDEGLLLSLQKWFKEFAAWAEYGPFGEALRRANNNIGVAYDIILIEMYLFSGEKEKAKMLVDNFADKRLKVQIDSDGKQPEELKRTNSFSYSLYNLSHILDFFFIAEYWYPNYYSDHKVIIDSAYSFLEEYEKDIANYPYQQIGSWSKCFEQLHFQLIRRERLRGNEVNLFDEANKIISLNVVLN